MKKRLKATYHHGTCHQCDGEGDVLTISGNPLDLTPLTPGGDEAQEPAVNGDEAGKDEGHTDTAVSTCPEKEGPVQAFAPRRAGC